MKLSRIIAFISALTFIIAGCQPKPIDPGPATISIDKASAEAEMTSTKVTVTVTSNYKWEATCSESWITVTPSSGEACPNGTTVDILVADNSGDDSVDRTGVVTFYGNGSRLVNASITISQKGKNVDNIKTVTVKEFIDLADTQTRYRLTGTVSGKITSTYTTFNLVDETGSILVYSFLEGGIMPEADVKNGATVTLTGIYEFYANKSQHEVTKAIIESHEYEAMDRSKLETISCAEFISKASKTTYYKLTGVVTSVSNYNGRYYFFISDDGGAHEVEVYTASDDNTKPFSEVEKGATVTVSGVYEYYKNASGKEFHEMIDAVIEEYKAPEKVDRTNLEVVTCAQYIAKADANTYYRIKDAKVVSVANNNGKYYFFISDDGGTSEVEVYEASPDNKIDFATVKADATVTVSGVYYKYTNSSGKVYHEMVDAILEEYKEAVIEDVESEKVADIVAAGSGAGVVLKNAVVAAVSERSALLTDGTDYILAYDGAKAPAVQVGDKVNVSGKRGAYSGTPQITEPVFTVISAGAPVPAVTATDITSTFDSFSGTVGDYVKFTGTLTETTNANGIKYYNVAVDGATRIGSLQNPSATALAGFVDTKCVIEGYYLYIASSKYLYVILTKVSPLEGDYFTVNPTEIDVTASTTSTVINVSTNQAWTATASDGFTVSPASGTGSAQITVSFAANEDTENAKTGTVKVSSSLGEQTVTITQQAKSTSIVLTFPDENSANNQIGSYTDTWTAKMNGYEYSITAFNNNKWGNNWTYIKAGRKNDESVATIATVGAMPAVKAVTVTVDKYTSGKLKSKPALVVANDASFSDVVETVTVDDLAQGDVTWNVTAPKAGLYYKLVFDFDKDGKANGIVQISKLTFVQ